MTTPKPLPDVATLKQLFLGQLPREQAAALLEQLKDGDVLSNVAANQTLLNALDTISQMAGPRLDPQLASLLTRLKALRCDGTSPAFDVTLMHPSSADGTLAAGNSQPPVGFSFLSPPQQADEMGRLGHFRILKLLGQGGMGMVFLAEDINLQRQVALKVMKRDAAMSLDARQRFLREARATAALSNDHIITIHHVGEERSVPFLAMQLLAGEPMDKWLERGRKPTVSQVLRLGREIARGLAAAHEKGLVHRDIKPGNLWLEVPSGRVKILDFGLARSAKDDVHLTQSGTILGTPAYMSPEQAEGVGVDHRCDLFSLGAVLYRLLAGRTPFRGATTIALLRSLAVDTPTPLCDLAPEVPQTLADLVMQLLAKNPAERPPTAKAVVEALQKMERDLALQQSFAPADVPPLLDERDCTVVESCTWPPPPPGVPAPRTKNPRRRVMIAAGLLALVGGLIAGIVIIVKSNDGSEGVIKETDKDKKSDQVEGGGGKRLFARWEPDGFSYPVIIEQRLGGESLVKYPDGITEIVPNWRLGFIELKVGDIVYGNWLNRGTYYMGTIAQRDGDKIRIDYEDGDVEDATIGQIRLKLVHPGANIVGCRVLGRWGADGFWYVGTVKEIRGVKYRIDFDDGDTALKEGSELYAYLPTYGDRVQGNRSNKGRYYDGRITLRKGDDIQVEYDTGEVENTTMAAVRVNPRDNQWRTVEVLPQP